MAQEASARALGPGSGQVAGAFTCPVPMPSPAVVGWVGGGESGPAWQARLVPARQLCRVLENQFRRALFQRVVGIEMHVASGRLLG